MSATPRVAINLLWCVPGEVGGSEEYLVRQLLGMAAIDAPYDLTIFAPRRCPLSRRAPMHAAERSACWQKTRGSLDTHAHLKLYITVAAPCPRAGTTPPCSPFTMCSI